jgi:hypothetical protein
VLIILAGLVAYSNSFRGEFIFDDAQAIVLNPHIQKLWPIWEAMTAPSQSSVSGRPMVSLTLAINYALGELNPAGYHDPSCSRIGAVRDRAADTSRIAR